jgi:glycosyltransferase involved in cell wall biosynthesis
VVSVVVPTRDRPLLLERCLDALTRQTVVDELEVIVVDDGLSRADQVVNLVEQEGFRLIRHDGAGPAAARNAGAAAARGRIICFTDDDCEPRSDWVEEMVKALDGGGDVVAGRTVSATPDDPFAAAWELVALAPAGIPAPLGSDVAFAPSNNIGCRVRVIRSVPFDARYPTAAGEDREWCARLLSAGFTLKSQQAAVVIHHHRQSVRHFLRQQIRYGRGAFAFRYAGGSNRPLEPPCFYVGLLAKAFRRGPAVGLLVSAAQVATATGFASEWVAARRRLSRRNHRPTS